MAVRDGRKAKGTDSSSLGRRDRERLQRREAMLEAAMEVFANKGFDNSSIDEIAALAEFGKGTVYNYFPEGKDGLLLAIFERIHLELADIGADALAYDPDHPISFRKRLSNLMIRLIDHFIEHADIFAILQNEASRLALGNDEKKAAVIQSQHAAWIAVLEPAVVQAMEQGELRKIPTRAAVRMILGSLEGFLRYRSYERCGMAAGRAANGPVLPPEEAAQLLTSMLMDGLGRKEKSQSETPLELASEKN